MAILLPDLTEKDVVCTTAVYNGNASPDQQRYFFNNVLMRKLCRRLDSVWVPGADGGRDTDFESGRQWVGVFANNMLHPDFLEGVKSGKYPPKPSGAAPVAPPKVNRKRPSR
jgi:hypothetical protein